MASKEKHSGIEKSIDKIKKDVFHAEAESRNKNNIRTGKKVEQEILHSGRIAVIAPMGNIDAGEQEKDKEEKGWEEKGKAGMAKKKENHFSEKREKHFGKKKSEELRKENLFQRYGDIFAAKIEKSGFIKAFPQK